MITVSIIIVAYKNKKIVDVCTKSIPKNPEYEVIIVDNSENNRGFGTGCNIGAGQANGKYLFFLNPDTTINTQTIPTLIKKLEDHQECGVIAPQLRYKNNTPYSSFSRQPRFWTAPIVYSFINSCFPQNFASHFHFYTADGLEKEMYIESASGAALFLTKKLFTDVGGFDKHIFLYWEDYDFCQKILNAHKKVLFTPEVFIIHNRGGSTPSISEAYAAFLESRKYIFIKRWGVYGKVLHELLTWGEKISAK